MRNYVGNPYQTRGAENYILQGAKGDGMHFLYVRNGKGLEAWISLDRAGDISRLTYKGDNMGFFSPCGYVSPQYYDKEGFGCLKSFTAGFFTTCGLNNLGAPNNDEGQELPQHGTISNTPAEFISKTETDDGLEITLKISDCVIFGTKLILNRKYFFSYTENTFSVKDTVTNEADTASPYMIMYHCNMGYPLLCENSIVNIPHSSITSCNDEAERYVDTALVMEKPQPNFIERCYYYDTLSNGDFANVGIYNPDIEKGLVMSYSKDTLPYFVEWKMMGNKDYVLGLEPSNSLLSGRNVLRKENKLTFLNPNESKTTYVEFKFKDTKEAFDKEF